jgi:hypothetical protein
MVEFHQSDLQEYPGRRKGLTLTAKTVPKATQPAWQDTIETKLLW